MFDLELLESYINKGLLTKRKHPKLDLYIYNYTQKVQYDSLWDEVTLSCRGLVLDSQGKVWARPFKKFFNLEELDSVPTGSFEVFDKLDGSLGIVFCGPNGNFHVATRGSFDSPQAIKGQEILNKLNLNELQPWYTYLFEIIYPENKIVVDYGDMEKMVLLAVIHTQTGQEISLDAASPWGYETVHRYDGVKDYKTVRDLFSSENKEGFVVKFSSGERVKLKFEEYVRIQRVLMRVTPLNMWKCLSYFPGKSLDLDRLLEKVPDEYYKEVKELELHFKNKFKEIEQECWSDIWGYRFEQKQPGANPTRKYAAKYFKSCKYPSVLFQIYQGNKYDKAIWRLLRPKGKF